MQRENPIEDGVWKLSFNVPVPQDNIADKNSTQRLKLNLLEYVLKAALSGELRQRKRHKVFSSEVSASDPDKLERWSEAKVQRFLCEKHHLVGRSSDHSDLSLSWEVLNGIKNLFCRSGRRRKTPF